MADPVKAVDTKTEEKPRTTAEADITKYKVCIPTETFSL